MPENSPYQIFKNTIIITTIQKSTDGNRLTYSSIILAELDRVIVRYLDQGHRY